MENAWGSKNGGQSHKTKIEFSKNKDCKFLDRRLDYFYLQIVKVTCMFSKYLTSTKINFEIYDHTKVHPL